MKQLKIGTRIDEGHEGEAVTLDIEKLIYSRALIQANSGGGKSGLLRVIAEQVAAHVPTIIIDKEGEYHTLREKLDIVLVGEQGELSADVRSAALLARKLVELGASAVIDLFDLKDAQRHEFVKQFFNALVNLPRKLWHPMFVLIDEAHLFCPEKGQGDSIAKSAALDLMTLGRKRGICGIPATQRLSKFDKNAAEVNNVFIGRTWLDVDQARAGKALGLSAKDALMLRDFEPRNFCAFGPALNASGVIRFRVADALTTIPKPGDRASLTPPKASHVVSEIADKLKDLSQQAETEIKDLSDAKARISQLTRELKSKPVIEKPVEKIKTVEKPVLKDGQLARAEKILASVGTLTEKLSTVADGIKASLAKISTNGHKPVAARPIQVPVARAPRIVQPQRQVADGDLKISSSQQRILDSLSWLESIGRNSTTKNQIALMADQSPTSGGYFNNLGSLRSAGLIEYPTPGSVALTDAGRAVADASNSPTTSEELHAQIYSKLSSSQSTILRELIGAYPDAIKKDDLAERVGQSPTSGGYFNNLGRLRTLKLIDYPQPGYAVATSILFLQ